MNFLKKNILSFLAILIVIFFFVVAIFFRTLSAEDLAQQSVAKKESFKATYERVLNYVPRVGEFYQQEIIRFFDYQFKFGKDTVFRVIDVFLCLLLMYYSVYLIIARRPKISKMDSLLLLLIFSIFFASPYKQFFVWFAGIHNYVIALLLLVMTTFYLFDQKNQNDHVSFLRIISLSLLGFLFGFSHTVPPVVIITMATLFIIWKFCKKRITIKNFVRNNLDKAFVFFGIFLGLYFEYFIASGHSMYSSSEYAKLSDYISLSEVFRRPIVGLNVLISHLISNLRPLLPFLVLEIFIVAASYFLMKREKYSNESQRIFYLQSFLIIFSVFSVLSYSQVNLASLGQNYYRLMSFVYFFITLSFVAFVYELIVVFNFERFINLILLGLIIFSAIFTSLFFISYNNYRKRLSFDNFFDSQNKVVCIERKSLSELQMPKMPFNIRHATPFEEWNVAGPYSASINNFPIIYSEHCSFK